MKKKLVLSILSLTLPLMSSEENHYSVWGEFLTLRRTQGINQKLINDKSSGTLTPCNTCDFDHCNVRDVIHDFHFEPGYRVGMGYFTPNWTTELTYFWIRDAHAECTRNGLGKIYLNTKDTDTNSDYVAADHGEAEYETGLQNAEANYYRYVTPRKKDYFAVAWLAGLRYTYLAEGLEITFEKNQDKSHYSIDSHNFLYGIQTGLVFEWNPWKWISWDLTTKVGVAVNFARQHTHWRDINDSVKVRELSHHRLQAPFLGDGILKMTLSPFKWWDVYLGYEVFYLAGVACAPDFFQKNRHKEPKERIRGYAIYYGWFGGCMFNF
ncbi:MAG: hypothetical protein JSR58_07500 [Verrucomicrobia bacterium]|nr:hypothetical protein [Verrucomicrobiota bacterium]